MNIRTTKEEDERLLRMAARLYLAGEISKPTTSDIVRWMIQKALRELDGEDESGEPSP